MFTVYLPFTVKLKLKIIVHLHHIYIIVSLAICTCQFMHGAWSCAYWVMDKNRLYMVISLIYKKKKSTNLIVCPFFQLHDSLVEFFLSQAAWFHRSKTRHHDVTKISVLFDYNNTRKRYYISLAQGTCWIGDGPPLAGNQYVSTDILACSYVTLQVKDLQPQC